MMFRTIHLIVVATMFSGVAGCQATSFGSGYKASNCGMTGTSCSRQGRGGTVTMNGIG